MGTAAADSGVFHVQRAATAGALDKMGTGMAALCGLLVIAAVAFSQNLLVMVVLLWTGALIGLTAAGLKAASLLRLKSRRSH